MATQKPYHAKGSEVYHNKRGCPDGKKVEKYNRKPGDGGKRQCKRCKKIRQQFSAFLQKVVITQSSPTGSKSLIDQQSLYFS